MHRKTTNLKLGGAGKKKEKYKLEFSPQPFLYLFLFGKLTTSWFIPVTYKPQFFTVKNGHMVRDNSAVGKAPYMGLTLVQSLAPLKVSQAFPGIIPGHIAKSKP